MNKYVSFTVAEKISAWADIFPDNKVPVQGPIEATLAGYTGKQMVYTLDMVKLSSTQMRQLMDKIPGLRAEMEFSPPKVAILASEVEVIEVVNYVM